MKRIVSLLLIAALLLGLLGACQEPAAGSEPPASEGPTALEVVSTVFLSCGFDGVADVEYLTTEDGDAEFLAAYLENAYGLAPRTWEDAAVIRATGASAFELAVLRMADSEAAVQASIGLMSYIFNRQGDFAGYAPAEADMVANGSISQDGPYAALFICPSTDSAGAAFAAAVNGEPLPEPPEDGPVDDVDELLALLVDNCARLDDVSDLEWLDSGDPEALEAYITDVYGLSREQWAEAAIARGKGSSVFEIAVLRTAEGQDSWKQVDALVRDYLDVKEEKYAVFSAQALLLSEAVAANPSGTDFVILAVCSRPEGTVTTASLLLGSSGYNSSQRHFQASRPAAEPDADYPDRIKFVQPNKDDMSLYDTSAIRAAWAAEDPSGLSDYDRDIYDEAQKVLDKVLKDGMSDLEKEKAVYSWLVNNVDYDWTHQDVMMDTPRESFTPYGGIVNHMAVCLGYATSFQLLMDLAGVECITVVGAAFMSQEDHGWNMVRLDGDWYCVDVTWDANYREQGATRGREQDWDYFNITSDHMASTGHQWDYANTPEAVTEGNGRG